MTLASRVITPFVKFILGSICRVDARELARLPDRGPLIIVTNHINFLEVPLIYAFSYPRNVIGLVKKETWDNPLLGFLATSWEAVPIDRNASDIGALKASLDVLARGGILAVAPEGTRSGDGRLGRGHAGVVQLAVRSGATLVPVVHFGGESFWANLRALRRTRVTFRVGAAFRIEAPEGGFTKTSRTEASDELMRRLARLLPPGYRGLYAEGLDRPERYLVDAEGGLAGKAPELAASRECI
jgi:1-acyl-sn-glycerol-3-phosphate acyltransferase